MLFLLMMTPRWCVRRGVCVVAFTPSRRVKYAKHKDTGEAVAIKIMNKSIIKERDLSRQVKHEVRLGGADPAGSEVGNGTPVRSAHGQWQGGE